jgi:PAS domain S-box-containing protein
MKVVITTGSPWGSAERTLAQMFAALLRLDVSISHNSWRLDDFWTNYGWLITTSAAMIVCYIGAISGAISNAGAFLLIAVVHSVFVGGYRTGIASASLSTLYLAIYLSNTDQLFRYSHENLRILLSLVAACFGTVFLIMHLRKKDLRTAEEVAQRIRTSDISAESEARFQTFANSAPVLLWLADSKGSRYFFNQPWLRFTGQTLESQIDQGWRQNIHPDDAAEVVRRYTNAVRSGEKYESEYRIRISEGQYLWVQDFGIPRISDDGVLTGYIGSCVDRTERKRVEKALHQLSGKLLGLQDEERRRISRELHDTTAQNLAVLSMNLFVVKEAAKVLPVRTQEAVSESLALAEQCSQEIRTLSYVLHPPLLDELGVGSALRAYTNGFTQRTGIAVELKMADIGRLPGEIETTLFRIVQEALTNVHRHSGSAKAEVRIIRDPRFVRLQVMDEGKGVPAQKFELISEGASTGVGIAGMRERAIQLGGQLKVASSSQGTTITAILPLKEVV